MRRANFALAANGGSVRADRPRLGGRLQDARFLLARVRDGAFSRA